MISTDAQSYFLCSITAAKNLYEYLGQYSKDDVNKFDGVIDNIQRNLSVSVYCKYHPDKENINYLFDIGIDEDTIEKEEK